MTEIPRHQLLEIDPDFEPLSRPRSCTWPLPRPEVTEPGGSSNTSSPDPSVKQEPGGRNTDFIGNLALLEETDDFEDERQQPPAALCTEFHTLENSAAAHVHPTGRQHQTHPSHRAGLPPPRPQVAGLAPPSSACPSISSSALAQRKSSSSRRNAWGNMSYADLITKAIDSSPDKRLTLAQIYDWMVKSVPYFKDKGDSNSSAGWKVSVTEFCGTL